MKRLSILLKSYDVIDVLIKTYLGHDWPTSPCLIALSVFGFVVKAKLHFYFIANYMMMMEDIRFLRTSVKEVDYLWIFIMMTKYWVFLSNNADPYVCRWTAGFVFHAMRKGKKIIFINSVIAINLQIRVLLIHNLNVSISWHVVNRPFYRYGGHLEFYCFDWEIMGCRGGNRWKIYRIHSFQDKFLLLVSHIP